MKVKAVIVDKRTGEVIEAFPSIESANAHLALEVYTLRNAEKMAKVDLLDLEIEHSQICFEEPVYTRYINIEIEKLTAEIELIKNDIEIVTRHWKVEEVTQLTLLQFRGGKNV